MKKIMDFMVAAYFSLVYKKLDETSRLERAIYVLNLLFILNIAAIEHCLIAIINKLTGIDTFYFENIELEVMVVDFIPLIIIGFMTLHLLEKVYLNEKGYSRILEMKIPRWGGVLVVIAHFLISLFLFFYTMRFLPHLPPPQY